MTNESLDNYVRGLDALEDAGCMPAPWLLLLLCFTLKDVETLCKTLYRALVQLGDRFDVQPHAYIAAQQEGYTDLAGVSVEHTRLLQHMTMARISLDGYKEMIVACQKMHEVYLSLLDNPIPEMVMKTWKEVENSLDCLLMNVRAEQREMENQISTIQCQIQTVHT